MNRPALRIVLVCGAIFIAIAPSRAGDRLERTLRNLEPETRLVQICNIETINRVGRDKNPYHPDRAVIDALSPPRIIGDLVEGTGGAFRSGGTWYRFSYSCTTSPDHMRVVSFS